jgi:hypothetical protein
MLVYQRVLFIINIPAMKGIVSPWIPTQDIREELETFRWLSAEA